MDEEQFQELLGCICMEDEEFWKEEKKHHFSAGYCRRKRKTLQKLEQQEEEGKYGFLPLYPVRRKRTFVVLVLLMILFMGIAITAKELQLKYLETMEIQGLDDHVQFTSTVEIGETASQESEAGVTAEEALTEKSICCPQYIPNGFEVSMEYVQTTDVLLRVTYSNDVGELIRFVQACSLDNTGISTDGEEMIDVMVGDYEGVYMPDGTHNSILWSDGRYFYLVSGPIPQEELLHMAESVE